MGALTEITVPDIGDFTDVPIVEVFVSEGDTVALEDPIVEIESDKASFEVPATAAGTVKEIKVSAGDKVSEGTVLIVVDGDGDGGQDGGGDAQSQGQEPDDGAAERKAQTAPAPEQAADRQDPQSNEQPEESTEPEPEAETETEPQDAEPKSGEPAKSTPPVRPAGGTVYASPTVRRLARERGVDLAKVRGTGDGGRVTAADIEGATAEAKTSTPEPPKKPEPSKRAVPPPAEPTIADDALGLAPWPSVDFERFGEVERVQLSRIGKLSAGNLARNWVRIPHVTHNDEADITDLEQFRRQLNAEQKEVKVTMVALLLKAIGATLREFPRFNSSLDGEELVLKHYFHIGFAADTPHGLVVPVVRDVDRKGVLELAAEVAELASKAREGKLMPAEMSGGTFSLSSLGGIGGTSFSPIINAPEVAILGVVRSVMRPVWDGDQFVPRLMLPLSLSYDHRVIDGAAAARFTLHLAKVLSDLRRGLL